MEQRLAGGNIGGAVLVDGTVRRPSGPWTPAVQALLHHPETVGWAAGCGATNDAVADFAPPPDAVWRSAGPRATTGDVVGHNDAAPYNTVWQPGEGAGGRLTGFVDWDVAAPCSRLWDLAFVAFSWMPLYSRPVAAGLGCGDPAGRPARLRLLLGAYGFVGPVGDVLDAVRERVTAHADGIRSLAAAGDPAFRRLLDDGVVDDLERALDELERDRTGFQAVAPSGG